MKNPLRNPWFLIFLFAYLVLFILKKSGVYIWLVSDYAADLLAVPVVLSIALWAIRISRPDRRDYHLKLWMIVFTVVLYAFLFEWAFPRMTDRFTADPWDALAYAIGGGFFAWRMNR